MPRETLRIATRRSNLALWQAEHIKSELEGHHPDLNVELVGIKTRGDKILDVPLARVGGKALFVKELEEAMLDGRADIAVHSMKDVPMTFPEGLDLVAICERGAPTDAFVSNHYGSVDELPRGAVVGTSSLRRQAQLSAYRPDFEIRTLRGNVNTRLSKLDEGQYDAIVLATSGLQRLGFEQRIRYPIPPEVSLPAVGQGALGIECRNNDRELIQRLEPLIHPDSRDRVMAERALNTRLEGGCQVPIGAYAELHGEQIHLRGLVASPDGATVCRVDGEDHRGNGQALGRRLAEQLLARGAGDILADVYGYKPE